MNSRMAAAEHRRFSEEAPAKDSEVEILRGFKLRTLCSIYAEGCRNVMREDALTSFKGFKQQDFDKQRASAHMEAQSSSASKALRGQKPRRKSVNDISRDMEMPFQKHSENQKDEELKSPFKGAEAFESESDHCILDELDQHCFAEPPLPKLDDDMSTNYVVGDLVWAKVKSHPWWPGQVFDAAHASDLARSLEKPGRLLVAFFGDHTFAWLKQSQVLAFKPNFEAKVKQTKTRSFYNAVSEILNEVCRRAELGLGCQCHKTFLHSECTFLDADIGILEVGMMIRYHKDISSSKEMLNARKTVHFVKGLACSPCGYRRSSLNASMLHGHALGIRTGLSANQKSTSKVPLKECLVYRSRRFGSGSHQGQSAKRSFSSRYNEVPAEKGTEKKKANLSKDETRIASSQSPTSRNTRYMEQMRGASEEKATESSQMECRKRANAANGKGIFDIKQSKRAKRCHAAGYEGGDAGPSAGKGARDGTGLGDDEEALLALGGHHSKLSDKSGEGATQVILVKNDAQRMTGSNNKADQQETSPAEELAIKPICYVRTKLGLKKQNKGLAPLSDNLASSSCAEKASCSLVQLLEALQFLAFDPLHNVCSDNVVARATAVFLGFRDLVFQKRSGYGAHLPSEGEEQVEKIKTHHFGSGEHDGPKLVAETQCHLPSSQKYDVYELAHKEVEKIDIPVDNADIHTRRKPVATAGPHVQSVAPTFVKHDGHKLSYDIEVEKTDVFVGTHSKLVANAQPRPQSVISTSQKHDVHELLLVAQKRKSEVIKEASVRISENAYETSAFERKTFSKVHNAIGMSAEQLLTTKPHKLDVQRASYSESDVKSPIQPSDNQTASQAPVGLFMKFPPSFALPSEAQLNAMFTPFGALQTAGTRVYSDTASAQVIFKHGHDAQNACKYAKENMVFGKTAVAFRLRHFSHSLRVQDCSLVGQKNLSNTAEERLCSSLLGKP